MEEYLAPAAVKLLRDIDRLDDHTISMDELSKRNEVDQALARELKRLELIEYAGLHVVNNDNSGLIGPGGYAIAPKGALFLKHQRKLKTKRMLAKAGGLIVLVASLIGNLIALSPQILELIKQLPLLFPR